MTRAVRNTIKRIRISGFYCYMGAREDLTCMKFKYSSEANKVIDCDTIFMNQFLTKKTSGKM